MRAMISRQRLVKSAVIVTSAPHTTPVKRVDEAAAAREASRPGGFAPVLRAPAR